MTEKPENWPFPTYGGPPLKPQVKTAPAAQAAPALRELPIQEADVTAASTTVPTEAPAPTRIWPFATEGRGSTALSKNAKPKVDVERTASGTRHVRRSTSYTNGSGTAEDRFRSHAPNFSN